MDRHKLDFGASTYPGCFTYEDMDGYSLLVANTKTRALVADENTLSMLQNSGALLDSQGKRHIKMIDTFTFFPLTPGKRTFTRYNLQDPEL